MSARQAIHRTRSNFIGGTIRMNIDVIYPVFRDHYPDNSVKKLTLQSSCEHVYFIFFTLMLHLIGIQVTIHRSIF